MTEEPDWNEVKRKTIAAQKSKVETYEALKAQRLPIPLQLKAEVESQMDTDVECIEAEKDEVWTQERRILDFGGGEVSQALNPDGEWQEPRISIPFAPGITVSELHTIFTKVDAWRQ